MSNINLSDYKRQCECIYPLDLGVLIFEFIYSKFSRTKLI